MWTRHLLAFVIGLVGVLTGLLIVQLWQDHQKVAQLWDLEIRRAQALAAQTPMQTSPSQSPPTR